MRWFIVFLIVANVTLFFWVQQQSRPLPGTSMLPPPDIGHLRLRTELEDDRKVDASAPAPVDMPSATSATSATSVSHPFAGLSAQGGYAEVLPPQSAERDAGAAVPDVSTAETGSEAEIGLVRTETESREAAPSVATDIEDQVDGTIVAAEQSVAQAQQAARQLAGTDPGEQLPAVEAMPVAPTAIDEPIVADKAVAECARVGPFDPEDADRLISGLPVNLQLLSDVTEEYARVDRYYVLIPALPSRAAGRQKLKELADAGFTDTWLFPSGEYRNAISLGYFSREGGAKRHAANIARKGFETEVKEKSSVRQRRWLLLKNAVGGDFDLRLPLPADVGVAPQVCP